MLELVPRDGPIRDPRRWQRRPFRREGRRDARRHPRRPRSGRKGHLRGLGAGHARVRPRRRRLGALGLLLHPVSVRPAPEQRGGARLLRVPARRRQHAPQRHDPACIGPQGLLHARRRVLPVHGAARPARRNDRHSRRQGVEHSPRRRRPDITQSRDVLSDGRRDPPRRPVHGQPAQRRGRGGPARLRPQPEPEVRLRDPARAA